MNLLTSGLQPPHTVEVLGKCFVYMFTRVCAECWYKGYTGELAVACVLTRLEGTANGRPCMAASISRPGRAFNCFGETATRLLIQLDCTCLSQSRRCAVVLKGRPRWTGGGTGV